MLLSTACSPWSSVTRSRFCWRQHLPVTLCFMHRWLFTIPGVISPLHSSTGRTLSLPGPCYFPLRQSKSPGREFRECFFFQLRKSQGLLLNCWWVPWAWLQWAAFHTSSAPSLENVPQPLGQQLGSSWDGLCWAETQPEQRANRGFCINEGFILDADRRWISWLCVPFPARKQLMGRVVSPALCTPEQRGFGRNLAHSQCCSETRQHFARCDGLACDGRRSWHPAGPMLSWSPITQSGHWKKAIFCLRFPLAFPCISHCSKLDVSLVFTYSV